MVEEATETFFGVSVFLEAFSSFISSANPSAFDRGESEAVSKIIYFKQYYIKIFGSF